MSQNLPQIILKLALSLDGYIDDSSTERRIFSNDTDRAAVDKLRSEVDAIFVGAETIRSDNPSLKVRDAGWIEARKLVGRPSQPLRVTTSRSLVFDSKLNFLSADADGQRSRIYTSTEADRSLVTELSKRVEVVSLSTKELELPNIFADLYLHKGVRRLMVEGGAQIISQVIAKSLADEVRLAIAPEFLGSLGGPRVYIEALFKAYNLSAAHNLEGVTVLELKRR